MKSRKIAIIGGGIGGLTAAYDLTNSQAGRKQFDITIYQMGWRLGGKCATGRNAGMGMRIEEHGIHGFLGSYYNALTMMKDVYEEWAPDKSHPLPDFKTAFPKKYTSFFWEAHQNEMKKWHFASPPNHRTIDAAHGISNLHYWIKSYIAGLEYFIGKPTNVPSKIQENTSYKKHNPNLYRDLKTFKSDLSDISDPKTPTTKIDWVKYKKLLTFRRARVMGGCDDVRRKELRIELLQVILRGIRDDQLETSGLKSVDREDFDAWLIRHCASVTLMRSPLVLATINTTYQYPDGDLGKKPVMSASSYLQWTLRIAAYIGAPYYLFAAGSGDTIVAPLYEVLKSRGVKFAFFHELTDIKINQDGTNIKKLIFNVQAQTKKQCPYKPLIRASGLDVWPNQPNWEQLQNAERLKELDLEAPRTMGGDILSLKAGLDFDSAILAIPPAAIPVSAPTLCYNNEKFAIVGARMATTATQSLQLWFTDKVKALTKHDDTFFLAGNYKSGLHGHADFSKFLDFEDWNYAGPKGLVYFSGVMTDPVPRGKIPTRDLGDLKAQSAAEAMLLTTGGHLFPGAKLKGRTHVYDYLKACNSGDIGVTLLDIGNAHAFDFNKLYSPIPNERGAARLAQQYCRGNVLPSERYTQAPPGTKALRINPLDTSIDNLTAAGDWVDTGLNVGSFEGAVIGGRLAACALAPSLNPDDILGLWPTQADRF